MDPSSRRLEEIISEITKRNNDRAEKRKEEEGEIPYMLRRLEKNSQEYRDFIDEQLDKYNDLNDLSKLFGDTSYKERADKIIEELKQTKE